MTALLAAGLIAVLVRASNRRAAESLDRYAQLVGGVVLQGVREAMLADDRPRLKKELAQFSSSQFVKRIDIVDKGGRIAFSSEPRIVGEELSRDSPSCTVCHDREKPPSTTARTIHYRALDGTMVFRFVQPIVAAAECLECHEETVAGQNLGILMTDLDEAPLIGRQLDGARTQGWAVAGAFALLLGSMAVIVRVVVVARLRNVKRVIEFARSGALASAPGGRSVDEIDDLERMVQCLAEDLEDRHALDRASETLAGVIERCGDPVLLTDRGLQVLAASPATATLFAPEAMAELVSRAQEDGWALGEAPGAPLVATVEDPGQRPLAYLAVWAAVEGEAAQAGKVRVARTDVEWRIYTAAIVASISREPKRWRGVAQLDRRLAAGRRVLGELAAAAAKLSADRAEVDLRSMILLLSWDLGRQIPDVTWRCLVPEQQVVTGTRYQLRVLVRRLAEAAAAQTGQGGQVVLFTQTSPDKSKVYAGAWARSDAPPLPVDGKGRLPLCELVARDHGGGVEINSGYDLGPLCTARGIHLPCDSRGVLFLAELGLASGAATPNRGRE